MLDYITKFLNDNSTQHSYDDDNDNDIDDNMTTTPTTFTLAATIKQSLQTATLSALATSSHSASTAATTTAAAGSELELKPTTAAKGIPTTLNANIKRLFNKTLDHVVNSNLSQYTALPPLNNVNASSSDMLTATLATTSSQHQLPHLEATTAFPTPQTVATFIGGNKSRATTIIVYPTVSPESIVIPIVSCIFGFPILALIVICCLRRRAKLARERDRRRNYDMQDHAVSLVRFSPIHRLNYRSSRAISLRPERSLSQGFTSIELDTVLEERCSDVEQTTTEILNAESPLDPNYKLTFPS